jgi:hypothetical protein
VATGRNGISIAATQAHSLDSLDTNGSALRQDCLQLAAASAAATGATVQVTSEWTRDAGEWVAQRDTTSLGMRKATERNGGGS